MAWSLQWYESVGQRKTKGQNDMLTQIKVGDKVQFRGSSQVVTVEATGRTKYEPVLYFRNEENEFIWDYHFLATKVN